MEREKQLLLLDEHLEQLLIPEGFSGYLEKNHLRSPYSPDEPLKYWRAHKHEIVAKLDLENRKGAALAYDAMTLIKNDLREIREGRACVVCHKPSSRRCARCKTARYCTEACQRQDWEQHRGVCREHDENNVTP